MDIDWKQIKDVWETDADKLGQLATKFGVSMVAISLKARQSEWGEKNCRKRIVPSFDVDILNDTQVNLAHKTDLGRLRLLAACVMEHLQFESNYMEILKATERLAKIYSQVIPLERKVFGMDGDVDDSPDSITLTLGKRNG